MNSFPRHVRTVRLRAPDEDLVRRGAILLEDALHTASLPGTNGGRLLVVRSLSVGTIHSNQSSASLALAIERRFHQLSGSAIHGDDPAASRQPVVYFRDDVEAYICLAVRVARGESPNAWFWPLMVPFWKPGMNRNEALRGLLCGVIETQAGITAVLRMIQELHEKKAVESLLSALQWKDGPALMREFGWSRPKIPMFLVEPPLRDRDKEALQHWATILDHWIVRWGADDTRSAWLAAIALTVEKPCRLLDPRLMIWAERLLKLAVLRRTRSISPQREASSKERTSARGPDRTARHAYDQDRENRMPCFSCPRELTAREKATIRTPDPTCRPGHSQDQETSDKTWSGAAWGVERPQTALIALGQPVDGENEKLVSAQSPVHAAHVESQSLAPGVSTIPKAQDLLTTEELRLSPLPDTPQRTAYAGLFFLVPVLSNLGISAFLEAYPHWIENELPARLFCSVCERLAVPPDDPIMSALGIQGLKKEEVQRDFIAPAIWRQGICSEGPWILRRMEDKPGIRILFDGSASLPLALWHGAIPDGVRELLGELFLKRGSAVAPEQDFDLVLKAWLISMRRWCRRYARIGLFDLVCRPGRISMTRTHVDILFDYHQADIRIRKSGLDFDPGWVDWIGRVVSFHYRLSDK